MTFTSYDNWWWPYAFILMCGWLPTAMWRYLGVYFAGDIDESAEVLVFVRALATALVAAVIAKLILYPDGALAQIPWLLRLGAAVAGFIVYHRSNSKVWLGVLCAEVILISGQSILQNS